MRRLFGCPDIVSLTKKFLMDRNFFWIFTENNPVMGYSKTFFIPEAKGLSGSLSNFTLIISIQKVQLLVLRICQMTSSFKEKTTCD